MTVTTVTGQIEAGELGITLPHEHVVLDLRHQFRDLADPEQQRIALAPLTADTIPIARRDCYAVRDNLLLDDSDLAARELAYFQKAGGRTVVDCTSRGLKGRPQDLAKIARMTGLNIIAGCGYYTCDTHPADMADRSEEALADEMIRDLGQGIDGGAMRAGIIGEIGLSSPIHPQERKNLRVAARAFRQCPAPIYVHIYPWGREGVCAVRLLLDRQVNPARVVICHVDVAPDWDYLRKLLALGVFVEFDNFGHEFSSEPQEGGFAGGAFASDPERIGMLKRLLDGGYENQILVSNDICLKTMLRAYGGEGYDNLLRRMIPQMSDQGIPEDAIRRFLVDNPRRLFGGQAVPDQIKKPRPAGEAAVGNLQRQPAAATLRAAHKETIAP